jgi:hypothetical protein
MLHSWSESVVKYMNYYHVTRNNIEARYVISLIAHLGILLDPNN